MTHDPMHNVEGLSGALYDGSLGPCRLCEFAAKVRADERRKHSDKTKHLRDRIERLIDKANRWRDENVELRKQLKELK